MSECKALTPSSQIVVVNDAAEAEFVLDQFSDDVHFWMGCKDDVDENYWLCEDNSGMYWNNEQKGSDFRGHWRKFIQSNKWQQLFWY